MKDFIKITMWLFLFVFPVLLIVMILKYLRLEDEALLIAISVLLLSNFFIVSYITFVYGNKWTNKVYNSLKSIFNLKK